MSEQNNNDLNDETHSLLDDQQNQNEEFHTIPNHIPHEFLNMFLRMNNPPNVGNGNDMTIRGAWSQQEDDLLNHAVNQLGAKKWMDIAKFVPTRTSKQCRERWIQRLAPNIKHEPFEPWEDRIILEKQIEIGNRWSVIAQSLPGRTSCAIKNRWYSALRNQRPMQAQMNLNHGLDGDTLDHSRLMTHDNNNDNVSNNHDL